MSDKYQMWCGIHFECVHFECIKLLLFLLGTASNTTGLKSRHCWFQYAVYIYVDCSDVSVLSVYNFGPFWAFEVSKFRAVPRIFCLRGQTPQTFTGISRVQPWNCRSGRDDLPFHFWLVVELTLVVTTKL